MYSEHEIKRMEAALALLRDSRQSVEGRLVRNALRGGNVNVRQLENELSDRLKLIGGRGDFWFLTAEGKTAAAMGMKAYLEERERKKSEPILTRNVEEKRPWWKFKKNDMAHDLFVSVISIILSQIISLIVFWLSKLL